MWTTSHVLAPASGTCCILQLRMMAAFILGMFGRSLCDSFFASNTFDRLRNKWSSHFDHAFPAFDNGVNTMACTRVDWVDTPEAHVFKADLPGMKMKEIKVEITGDGVLSISGERRKEEVHEKNSYRNSERFHGKFYRQFKLPKNSKPQDTSAKIENGVLTVTVPKTKESKEEANAGDVKRKFPLFFGANAGDDENFDPLFFGADAGEDEYFEELCVIVDFMSNYRRTQNLRI